MAYEKMAKKGYAQGDMSPTVESYQTPTDAYSQNQFGSTLNYVNRTDSILKKEASQIRKQGYKGRYS